MGRKGESVEVDASQFDPKDQLAQEIVTQANREGVTKQRMIEIFQDMRLAELQKLVQMRVMNETLFMSNVAQLLGKDGSFLDSSAAADALSDVLAEKSQE